jgi:hypothetical protein
VTVRKARFQTEEQYNIKTRVESNSGMVRLSVAEAHYAWGKKGSNSKIRKAELGLDPHGSNIMLRI